MRTDSIKKYVLPNIPYLFVLWACLKLGTAYRLAAGADFAHKLMGLGQTIARTQRNSDGMKNTDRPAGAPKKTSSPLSIRSLKTTSF